MYKRFSIWFPVILTVVFIFGASIIYFKNNISTSSQIGDYLSGIVGTLGFIWLIVGYFQQINELKLQREELKLQRNSLDLQREELQKMSKFSALDQISSILQNFNSALAARNIDNIKNIEDLFSTLLNGMKDWKIITESSNVNEVFDKYNKWITIKGTCENLFSVIVSCIELYDETIQDLNIERHTVDYMTIHYNFDKIKKVPYIQQYIGSISGLIHLFMQFNFKYIDLAGLEAINKIIPRAVHKETIDNLRKELNEPDNKRFENNQYSIKIQPRK